MNHANIIFCACIYPRSWEKLNLNKSRQRVGGLYAIKTESTKIGNFTPMIFS